MKFIKFLFICLLLCGCSLSSPNLDEIFSNSQASKARLNNYAKYINYYVPSDLHEISCDDISYVYELDDDKIIMNINIAGIVNEQYDNNVLEDDGFFDSSKLYYSYNGCYYDESNNEVPYFFNVYQYDDDYLMHFVDIYVNIYGYCKKENIELIASKIYDLAKSVEVDTDTILVNYSSKDVIEYKKATVNLFETVMPVEGRIDDMMIGDDSSVSDN